MEQFFGLEVLSKETQPTIPEGHLLRITQIALPEGKGKAVVSVVDSGKRFAICSLNSETGVYHMSTELVFTAENNIAFLSVGTPVHITGTLQLAGDDDLDMASDDDMDDMPPPPARARGAAAKQPAGGDDDEEDDEGDEMDEGDFDDEDDEADAEEDDDDDDDEPQHKAPRFEGGQRGGFQSGRGGGDRGGRGGGFRGGRGGRGF